MDLENLYENYESSLIYKRGTINIASISDLHFPVKNIGPQLQYEILKDQFIDKLENIPIDIIFVLGDLYDHKVLTTSDAALYASMFIGRLVDLCRRKGITLLILQGTLSHDSNQLKLYYHYINDPTVDVRIVTKIGFEYIKNVKVLCIPELYFVDESEYDLVLNNSGLYDIAVMHGTFNGSVYGNNSGNSRLFYIEDFNNCRGPILAGHVHKPDCFDDHFYYNGSPYAWSFADDHNKGYILMSYNLDTRKYIQDWVWIKSFKYKTITIEDITNNDPQYMISYIDKLKMEQGIDFIRIIFKDDINNLNRSIIYNNYRNNNNVSLVFPESEDEKIIRLKHEENNNKYNQYSFLLDNSYSSEEKFCMYINKLKGEDQYITVDELREILNSAS